MFYDPRLKNHGLPHDPWTALVVPRPIGWISTSGPDGTPNLAPYSFFNAISARPPFVVFGSGGRKDTISNLEKSGVFAVNTATWALREQMNLSSDEWPREVDEFQKAQLTVSNCTNIECPRVAESPITLECHLNKIVSLETSSGELSPSEIVIGEVVGVHINDEIIRDGRVTPALFQPIGRLGYMDYAVIDSTFEMLRPTSATAKTPE